MCLSSPSPCWCSGWGGGLPGGAALRLLIPVAVFCFPNYVLGYPTMGAMGLAKFANISVVFGTFVYLPGWRCCG